MHVLVGLLCSLIGSLMYSTYSSESWVVGWLGVEAQCERGHELVHAAGPHSRSPARIHAFLDTCAWRHPFLHACTHHLPYDG